MTPASLAARARRKFLSFFPGGFQDETYLAWERGYKWAAHQEWERDLRRGEYRDLLEAGEFQEIAGRALRIEGRTNLLFSYEKMALRDAVRPPEGARAFATGLYDFVYGPGAGKAKFDRWCETLASLPRKQSRVLTWPTATILGFVALPRKHIYLKPRVTIAAARAYGFEFQYRSRPAWPTYASLLEFADRVSDDLADLQPRDMIDIQSFLWVLGSSEYD